MGCMTLVTGGAGFVGSHLVRGLLARGDEVRVLDDLSTGRRANLSGIDGDVDFVEGDLRDDARVRSATRGVEVVFHQGALPSVPRSVRDPISTSAVNVEGTVNVLTAARDADVRRVVVASSSSVYGNSGRLPHAESDHPDPISPYAVSKLAAERYCASFSRTYRLDTVALRYFNVFGPNQDPTSPYAAVVPSFISAIAAGAAVSIFGDGAQSRDFTYVADVVEANLRAADSGRLGGAVLNVAAGRSTTVNALADMIGALMGRPVSRRHLAPRQGEVRDSWADVGELQRVLGYEPRVSLDEGLGLTIDAKLVPSNGHRGDDIARSRVQEVGVVGDGPAARSR
jgi:UDP-glucose 4-epimerase